MTEHHFETPRPVQLYVEIGSGDVRVEALDTTQSRVEVGGRNADDVRVELTGDELSVIAPRHLGGLFSGDGSLAVVVTVPTGSDLATKTGSADVTATGTIGHAQVRSGSGSVRLEVLGEAALLETGSGDVQVQDARGELRVKSGSGDVQVAHTAHAVSVSTGSGDVVIGDSEGPAVVKTGSGDLLVRQSQSDVSLSTGSGDLEIGTAYRGRLTVKGASGDVRVGIPAGVPVWTDVSTISGRIHSTLDSAGEPREGQDHVELRATTVSGDVLLTQV